VDIVWSITTRTRVSGATAVTFSVECLNPLKFYPLSGTSLESGFLHTLLFIHEHLIIMWSPAVNPNAVTTLLLTSGFIAGSQEHLKDYKLFYAVRISISLAILSEIFKLVTSVLRVMHENKSGCFFLNTVYFILLVIFLFQWRQRKRCFFIASGDGALTSWSRMRNGPEQWPYRNRIYI